MKRLSSICAIGLALSMSFCAKQQQSAVEKNFDFITTQLPVAINAVDSVRTQLKASGKLLTGLNEQVVPCSINGNGTFGIVGGKNWTSGFFPGLLWYTYEYTQDPQWKEQAEKFTAAIEATKYRTDTHDLGFIVYCSFGNGYRLTGSEAYKDVIITASDSLITRFNPSVGLIRSWDHSADRWNYPVIIDNMMNLEMLCEATKITGDKKYFDVAIHQADNTMKNHFREDYSCYHVVDYDPTGKAVKHETFQGYSDDSAWARGQAWALYGYTMMYRETGYDRYLKFANNVANFILTNKNLPADKVPYWDFDAPDIPNAPRDVSAAAVISSALYELSTYTPEKAAEYVGVADKILETIAADHLCTTGGDYGFITTHSVGHFPANGNISVPMNYADYYYAEALVRKDKLERTGRLF